MIMKMTITMRIIRRRHRIRNSIIIIYNNSNDRKMYAFAFFKYHSRSQVMKITKKRNSDM